jgi:type IV pilus assembly protein PilY1
LAQERDFYWKKKPVKEEFIMKWNTLRLISFGLCLMLMVVGGILLSASNSYADSTDIDAAFGTNNSGTDYWPPANGTGGTVQFYSRNCSHWNDGGCSSWNYSWTSMSSGHDTSVSPYGTSPRFKVTPSNGFRIKFIKYAERGSQDWGHTLTGWTSVVPSDPTVAYDFTLSNITMSNTKYVLWVCFEAASANYTVTASVFQDATPTTCQSTSYITQIGTVTGNSTTSLSTSVVSGGTTDVSFSAGTGCEVQDVLFNGNSVGIQASPYTTSAINSTSTVVVKFRPATYTITSSIDSTSPGYVSGTGLATSGSISPMGATAVGKNASQTFTITPASGFRILNVRVTDANMSYTNKDLGAISNQYGTSYTFSNVTVSGTLVATFASDSTTVNNYCQTPPFLSSQTSLKPNVLIIFDTSGSMGDYAYSANNATYSSNTSYYGYYDNTKMYKITSSTVHNINSAGLNKAAACSSQSTNNICSGNELNFRNMKKVDVIRRILMGGKINDRTATTKYLLTNNGKQIEYGTSLPTGVVQVMDGKVRFGLMVFNANGSNIASMGGGDGGKIVAQVGSAAATLITVMEGTETDPGGNTPLAESLYEAIRYFEAMPSAYNTGVDYGTMDPVEYLCQKHFVLMITDGQPTNDANIPGESGATVTDTSYTAWKATANAKTTKPTTGLLPWVAYYAHVNDLRSATVGKSAILGKQNITLYTVYTFGDGTGANILKEAARYGGFNDTDELGTAGYLVPDKLKEYHAAGTTDAPNTVEDNYFQASQGEVLETSIIGAIEGILAKVASGTAASILSNSEGSGANLLQAVFYPNKIFKNSTSVDWIGEMQNLWYYVDPFLSNSTIREDTGYTSGDHTLNLKSDYVVRFYFNDSETLAELKEDTNGDGAGEIIRGTDVSPDDVNSLWRAGKLLWSRTAESRTIHTSIDGQSLYTPVTDSSPPKGGFYTGSTRATGLIPYLQAADLTEAQKLIGYIRGTDPVSGGYRNRTVSLITNTSTTTYPLNEWKLGDIITSTPRIQSTNKLHTYNLDTPAGYGDKSYASFIKTPEYKKRGMVYVGANDGMLHAFKLGTLTVSGSSITGDTKAILSGTNLGEEQWAYIPRNALPYLKYYADPNSYKHIYYVDGPTVLMDAAIAKPSACSSGDDYSACLKDETGGTNWKTVLIGSMGLGGASRLKGNSCTNGSSGTCVKTPIYDPTDTASTKTKGIGYSSYFALDISGQYFNTSGTTETLANQPTLKWEFSHPDLGYATSGAALVRISAKKSVTTITNGVSVSTTVADTTKNGKSFAVFASGPTGPIDEVAHQFLGRSDQNLKLFVVDLGASGALTENTNYWVIDTGITQAFGGSMVNAAIDTDRWKKTADGNYQDDAIYVGYTQYNSSENNTDGHNWTKGGVIRLITKEDVNPANWKTSTVISGVGPVTSGVSRLQDRKNHKLWLYFGGGRFYFGGDDPSNRRYIAGVTDSCYKNTTTVVDTIDKACADTPPAALTMSDLKQQDTIGNISSEKGWYITLDAESTSTSMGAERSITDPVALTNGLVQFTTFKPTSDVCKFGGDSYIWGVKYDTGGTPPGAALDSKVLVQVSTGAFEEVTLRTSLTANSGRKMGTPMVGKPPSDPPPVISNAGNKPSKKILHLQEK